MIPWVRRRMSVSLFVLRYLLYLLLFIRWAASPTCTQKRYNKSSSPSITSICRCEHTTASTERQDGLRLTFLGTR